MIVIVARTGCAVAFGTGSANLRALELELAEPVLVVPQFNLGAFLSLTVPLVVVSLTGQYLPGMAVLQLAGTGLATLPTACFGGITIVLAAIKAALCTGKDAHADPGKRCIAGIANGVFYLVGGVFAGTIVQVFSAFPPALIAAFCGVVFGMASYWLFGQSRKATRKEQ